MTRSDRVLRGCHLKEWHVLVCREGATLSRLREPLDGGMPSLCDAGWPPEAIPSDSGRCRRFPKLSTSEVQERRSHHLEGSGEGAYSNAVLPLGMLTDLLLYQATPDERSFVACVGHYIRCVRGVYGYTRGALARQLGMPVVLITMVENGDGNLQTASRLYRVVKRYRRSLCSARNDA